MNKKLLLAIINIIIIKSIFSQTEVIFYTGFGSFNVEVYDSIKPITGGNFLSLINSKYYDGIIFHRVVKNYFIQTGDTIGNGSGQAGYTIADEFDTSLSNIKKTLSMANDGVPNTGSAQFFINTNNNSYLDGSHPVFGIVISGWEIVDSIENVSVNNQDWPLSDVTLDSIRVKKDSVILVDTTTGIYRLKPSELTAKIYPNPIFETSSIILSVEDVSFSEISIVSPNGKVISTKEFQLKKYAENIISLKEFDIDFLSKGFYFINIKTANSKITKSFLVE